MCIYVCCSTNTKFNILSDIFKIYKYKIIKHVCLKNYSQETRMLSAFPSCKKQLPTCSHDSFFHRSFWITMSCKISFPAHYTRRLQSMRNTAISLRHTGTCEINGFLSCISSFNKQWIILLARFYGLLLVIQFYLHSCFC